MKCDELQIQEQRLDQKKRDVAEQTQIAKQYMMNAFEELRQRIDSKEREMLQKCDDLHFDYLNELD